MNVNYRQVVNVPQEVYVKAKIDKHDGRKVYMSAVLTNSPEEQSKNKDSISTTTTSTSDNVLADSESLYIRIMDKKNSPSVEGEDYYQVVNPPPLD